MMYSQLIEQHFAAPHYVQQAGTSTSEYLVEAGAVDIGAYLQLFVQIDDKLIISEAHYKAYGCPTVIALGSWLTCWLRGKSLAEAVALKEPVIQAALALAPHKRHLAALAVNAVSRLTRLID